ncbi:MAG: extracellular solute-binding protein [Acidimicrobiia bacterium]|nr:extracellular solute-binding protein [Acidimicrobiia bacterium]
MLKKWTRIIAVLSVAALLAAACDSGDDTTATTADNGETSAATEAPAEGGVTVNWAVLAGFYTDWAEEVAAEWEAETGNNLNVVGIDFPVLYENQVLESVSDTGAYDILTYDVGWKAEFSESGHLLALDDLLAAAGDAASGLNDVHPALLETTSKWRGQTYGLPYYTFTMGMFYRCDLWEDPTEMADFEAAYGYPLAVPRTYDQMADMAEFFRRAPGDTLKGEAVAEDFYGIGLMAGRFPHVQDEINSIAWTNGAKVINDDGTPGVTDPEFVAAVDLYVNELLPFAPPGAGTSAFNEVVGQMQSGLISMTAGFYLDQYPNMIQTEQLIEGARICAAPSPGAHTWVGAFGLGISPDSENPEAALSFLSFLFSESAQRRFAEGGGSSTLTGIISDDALVSANPLTTGHYPTLLEVLDHQVASNYIANYLFVPQGGKIYDEMTTWYSAAAAGEETPQGAMEKMAEAIERACGGPCEVANDALGAGYSPTPAPFPYDELGY